MPRNDDANIVYSILNATSREDLNFIDSGVQAEVDINALDDIRNIIAVNAPVQSTCCSSMYYDSDPSLIHLNLTEEEAHVLKSILHSFSISNLYFDHHVLESIAYNLRQAIDDHYELIQSWAYNRISSNNVNDEFIPEGYIDSLSTWVQENRRREKTKAAFFE